MGGLLERDILDIKILFNKFSQIRSVILFGSRAKGNFKKGSDIDLAVTGENLDYHLINTLNFELNENTVMPYKFDIININTIKNKDLLDHINRVGKVIYSINNYTYNTSL